MDLCCTLAKWQQCWLCPVHLPSEWWRWLLCCMLAFSWMALCCVLRDGNALTPLLYTCHLSEGIDLMTLCWTFAEWWHWWLYIVHLLSGWQHQWLSVVHLPSEWWHLIAMFWVMANSHVVHFNTCLLSDGCMLHTYFLNDNIDVSVLYTCLLSDGIGGSML